MKNIILESMQCWLDEAEGNGWTKGSFSKAGTTLAKHMNMNSSESKGFFDKCIKKLMTHMTEEQAKGLCAKMKDSKYGSTMWRGKNKSAKEVKKDVAQNQNVK